MGHNSYKRSRISDISKFQDPKISKMKTFAIFAVFLALVLAAQAACPKDDNGNVLQEVSIDGCNSCHCSGNGPACTRMGCPPSRCYRNSRPDPCNFCNCVDGNA